MLTKNIGSTDRIIRLIVGVLFLIAFFLGWGWFFLIGIIPLVTALISSCPLYSIFGMNTCKK